MTEKRLFWIVWNEGRVEGAVFDTKRDAESAIDGEPWSDPAIGFPSISTLAEKWFECYGDEDCSIEEIEL